MKTFMKLITLTILAGFSTAALAVNWDGVAGKDLTLFYPGQAAWEWVLVPSDHSAAPKLRQGKVCRDCHEGEEADIGALIVSGEKLEPDPPAGKPGSIPLNVAVTRDADTLYIKFEWTDPASDSGHDSKYESRVTMMIGDESVRETVIAGCWGTCHNDVKGMPNSEDLTKYLAGSRTGMSRSGGGTNYKPDAEIQKMIDSGYFIEYWQAKLNRGEPAVPADGVILKDRSENENVAVQADATFKDGKWTVILSRKLAGDDTHKALESGVVYPVGFAIHEGHAEHRFHHVSLEYTLAVDSGDADFVATQ